MHGSILPQSRCAGRRWSAISSTFPESPLYHQSFPKPYRQIVAQVKGPVWDKLRSCFCLWEWAFASFSVCWERHLMAIISCEVKGQTSTPWWWFRLISVPLLNVLNILKHDGSKNQRGIQKMIQLSSVQFYLYSAISHPQTSLSACTD